MPIPRFRIRTLMIAVAVVAVIAGSSVAYVRIRARRERFSALVKTHHSEELIARSLEKMAYEQIDTLTAMRKLEEPSADAPDPWSDVITQARLQATQSRSLADYHAALKRKYEHAAARPWLPAPPDPPPPN